MPDLPVLNILCQECQSIFEGHWVCRDEVEIKDPKDEDITEDGALGEGSLPSGSESSSDDDGDFYEKPDWVKSTSVDGARELSRETSSFFSPLHHSIEDLEVSAQNGCHLCTLFRDRLLLDPKYVTELEEARLQRAKGVIIVRPESNVLENDIDTQVPQPLMLNVSYFLDGNCERESSHLFTIDFDIQFADNMKASSPISRPNQRVSESTLQSIRAWVVGCLSNHDECQAHVQVNQSLPPLKGLPTRLLDLTQRWDRGQVTLEETINFDPTSSYITLSHCWGSFLPVRLLKSLFKSFREGILIKELPKTFQDAIEFARALQIRYLWIDALCIIQDSQADWLREALLMSSVYSNSWLNLAATSSTNSHGGLFHSRNFVRSSPCTVTASWKGFAPGSYTIIDGSAWTRRVEDSPLNQRAWVLQERLLAPRTIHFAFDQIFWECRHTRACETFPKGVPDYASRVIDTLTEICAENLIGSNEEWLHWVKEYTKKTLTRDSDKLVAIAGLATYAQRKLNWTEDDYVAGLWRYDLSVDLLWRVAGVGAKISSYVAPSWSWASIRGEIYFNSSENRNIIRRNLAIKIISIAISPMRGGMGPVHHGYLTIQGPLHRIHLSKPDLSVQDYPCLQRLMIGTTEFDNSSDFEDSLDDDSWYHQWHLREQETYFCRFMTAPTPHLDEAFMSEGLILEHSSGEGGIYRRIGWLRIFLNEPQIVFAGGSAADELAPEEYISKNDSGEYSFTII